MKSETKIRRTPINFHVLGKAFFITLLFLSSQLLATPISSANQDSMWMARGVSFVKAKVNGVEGKFLIDNGFSLCALSKEFIKENQIKLRGSVTGIDANSQKVKMGKGKVKDIEVAGVHFNKIVVMEVDTRVFFPCMKIDGVIGASIINRANWKFDYENGVLTVDLEPIKSEGIEIEATYFSNNRAALPLTILGKEVMCRVDLGMSASFGLDRSSFVEPIKKVEHYVAFGSSSISVGGLGAVDTNYYNHVPLTIGYEGGELPNKARVYVANKKYSATVGLGYLKNYELTINSDDKKYILNNKKEAKPNSEVYPIAIYPVDGQLKITKIYEAYSFKTGLQVGDVILSINGNSAEELIEICTLKSFMKNLEEKKETMQVEIESKGKEDLPYLLPTDMK